MEAKEKEYVTYVYEPQRLIYLFYCLSIAHTAS